VGEIAYFEGNCPDGWKEYINGKEKFIINYGVKYPIGSTGGE
jgi:hypothetical protein